MKLTESARLGAVVEFSSLLYLKRKRKKMEKMAELDHIDVLRSSGTFSPVVVLPLERREKGWVALDLTGGAVAEAEAPWTVGKYNEVRRGMYTDALFAVRNIHIGIDFCAPVGTPVASFFDGTIESVGYNDQPGDYGHVIVVRYDLGGLSIWALYGHLSARSTAGKEAGQAVAKGEVIAWLGAEDENGGWPPHLHFQLARRRPPTHDMPGVVAAEDHAAALADYPDPRIVCGAVY